MKKGHIIIVGGTRGMGRALARVMKKAGYSVSAIGRHYPSKPIPGVFYRTVDLLDKSRLEQSLKEILMKSGKISSLVFFQRYRDTGDAWRGELETSLSATRNIIEYLADKFDPAGEKAIVLVSSVISHFIGSEQPVGYHVAKAGLSQMARYYAYILGRRGIRVNTVSPSGCILKEESKYFYLRNKQLHNLYKKIIPLGRMGSADEVAAVIAFLCGNKASFVTGQDIIVDGGVSLSSQESLARQLTPLKKLKVTR